MYPILVMVAFGHQTWNYLMVILKRRPKLLLKSFIRPENHYNKVCNQLKKLDVRLLSSISHRLAACYVLKLVETPTKMPCIDKDQRFEQEHLLEVITFAGKRIAVYCHTPTATLSNDKTLLLIHGWEGRSIMFRPFIEPLTHSGFRVIMPDLPAHGASGGQRCGFRELADFITMLGRRYGPFDAAIGHSCGGIALGMALEQGLQLERLVTIGSPKGLGSMLDTFVDYYQFPVSLKEALRRLYVDKYSQNPDAIGIPLWATLQTPTLICHDRHDATIALTDALEMEASFPNSELHLTSGWGHRGVLKDPTLHAKIISYL
nr:hypothetical protein BCU43_17650 [Vibrio lentus]